MPVPNLLPPVVLLVGHVLLLLLVAVPPHVLIAFRRSLEYVSWSESYTELRCHDGHWLTITHFDFVVCVLGMVVAMSRLLLTARPLLCTTQMECWAQ